MGDWLEQAKTYFQPTKCVVPCVDIGYMPLQNYGKDFITFDEKMDLKKGCNPSLSTLKPNL